MPAFSSTNRVHVFKVRKDLNGQRRDEVRLSRAQFVPCIVLYSNWTVPSIHANKKQLKSSEQITHQECLITRYATFARLRSSATSPFTPLFSLLTYASP